MFGEQSSAMTQQLMGAGMSQSQSNALASVIGQCMATLKHRGSVSLYGPLNMLGNDGMRGIDQVPLVDPRLGAVLFGGSTFDSIFTAGAAGTPGAKKGTLAGDLTRDGTATLNLVGGGTLTVGGYFVKSGWKISSGKRVGAISFDGGETWDAIVTDDCLVAA